MIRARKAALNITGSMYVMVLKQDLISPLIEEGDWLSPVLYSKFGIQSLNCHWSGLHDD